MTARQYWLALAVFAVTFLCFARLCDCDFVLWDDDQTIFMNPRLNPPSLDHLEYYWTHAGEKETMGLYVPITYTVWSAVAEVSRMRPGEDGHAELNPFLFHATNVLVHSITAALVFALLMKLSGAELPALLGALLFALHPVQVEPVGWTSGTKDLLCGMFSILALLLYVRQAQRQRDGLDKNRSWGVRFIPGTLALLFAVLSKPTAVMVPLMAGAISLLLLRRSLWKTVFSLLPWILLISPFLVLTQIIQPPARASDLPAWGHLFVAADAIAFYIGKILWPIRSCVDYGHTPRAILANHEIWFTWIVPALLVGLLLWKRKSGPTAAALLFVLPLVPVLGFVPFDFQQYSSTADHYLYLPMFAVALLATFTLRRIHKQWVYGGATAVVAVLGLLSIRHEPVWQNSRTLFENDVRVNYRSLPGCTVLGYLAGKQAHELKARGRLTDAAAMFDESTGYYQRALERDPDMTEAMLNIVVNSRETGKRDLELAMIRRIVRAQDDFGPQQRESPETIAKLFDDAGDIQGEVDWLESARALDPQNPQIEKCLTLARKKLKPSTRMVPTTTGPAASAAEFDR
jgi:hypothetical protein